MSTQQMAARLRNTMHEADLDEDTIELLESLLLIDTPPVAKGDDAALTTTLNEGFDTAMSAVHRRIADWLTTQIDD